MCGLQEFGQRWLEAEFGAILVADLKTLFIRHIIIMHGSVGVGLDRLVGINVCFFSRQNTRPCSSDS